jgi:lysyl-tRNA synthetase class 1
MEIKGRMIEGCGHKGEANVLRGEGKLTWKGEFAARWKALDIRFEAYGKDIADSVRINDRICKEVLCYEPPSHVQYEMFLDKSGKKISKSTGNVFTPQVWFRYGSPQALLLLMLKRFVGTRTLDVTDIPSYMNEWDILEETYFGKTAEDKKELVKLRGLYEYCCGLKPPAKPSIHVPYNLMTFLVKMAPHGNEETFIIDRLQGYGILQKGQKVDENLKKRITFASNWIKDFEEIKETPVSLSEKERSAVIELTEVLQKEEEGEKVQYAVFEIAKKNGIQPTTFFRTIYSILLGVPQGPRLGPYLLAMGKQNVSAALNRALKGDEETL